MTLLAYGDGVLNVAMPEQRKDDERCRAVTAIGTASVAHQTAIQTPTAATCVQPSVRSRSGPATAASNREQPVRVTSPISDASTVRHRISSACKPFSPVRWR